MKQVTDRERLRREQKRKEMIARAQETLLGYVFVGCVLATTTCIIGVVLGIYWFLSKGHSDKLMVSVSCALGAFLFGWLTIVCCRSLTRLKLRIERLSYTPRANVGPLPSAEVLVRGAEAPSTVQSEILLRAAKGQEIPQEELLRAPQE